MKIENLKHTIECVHFKSLTSSWHPNHACSEIIKYQKERNNKRNCKFQVPEPWSGDIKNAPILFVSSNPGYSADELYPTTDWPTKFVADFFINRFKDRSPNYSWVFKHRTLLKDGTRSNWVRYWASIKKRAEELLEREAIPGVDYCLSELVQCKSMKETGVESAQPVCTRLFFNEKINLSGAKIIIGVGKHAKNFFDGKKDIEGIPVYLIPHPNSRQPKTFNKLYTDLELANIRKILSTEKRIIKSNMDVQIKLPSEKEVEEFINTEIKKTKRN